MTAVRVQAATVRLGDKEIVSEVDFVARPGEITALIGPNGAGKSTLLAAIAGDVTLAHGSVHMGKMDISAASANALSRTRAVMLQDMQVALSFLVRDVAEMGRRPWSRHQEAEDDDQIVDAALQATDIIHLAAREAMTLSGGERARMALSRVLAQRTSVILLDEPTAAMDIRHQEQSLGLARTLAKEGATVILVVHDLNAAAAYADHIVCLSAGRVVADGTVSEIYTAETLSSIYDWPIEIVTLGDGQVCVLPRGRTAN